MTTLPNGPYLMRREVRDTLLVALDVLEDEEGRYKEIDEARQWVRAQKVATDAARETNEKGHKVL